MKSSKILGAWIIIVALTLFVYVLNKLINIGWFANVTFVTLLVTSIFGLAVFLGLFHITRYFFSKENK